MPKSERPTVLREPLWATAAVYVIAALCGAVVGRLAGLLADWLVTLPWAPMKGPAALITSIPAPAHYGIGLAAGLAVGFIAQYEQLVLRLDDSHVELVRKGRRQRFAREDVAVFCRDGKRLVVLGTDGGELARHDCGLNFTRVADTVTAHGYSWSDTDPYKDDFRLWVPGLPGLSEGANALLKARQKSLESDGSDDEDVRELREELARLGVVVRDEKRRQYVRTLTRTRLRKPDH